jgi:phage FluMu protein Com
MKTLCTELRCKHCKALLAKRERDALSICRGGLQATITGTTLVVSLTCYRCQALNVF